MSRPVDGTRSGHPIVGFLELLEAGLDDIADVKAWSLSASEVTEAVVRMEADLARLGEIQGRLFGQADALDLPGEMGARSLAVWLSRMTRLTSGEANRRTRLAETLKAHDQVRAAVAGGGVLCEQAAVIGQAVDDLDEQYASERSVAESYLIGKAAEFDAHELRRLGQRLFEVVDPDGADAYEAKLLEKREAQARKKTEFRLRSDGQGLSHGTFTLPDATASMLMKALHGLASPKHVRAYEGAGAYVHEKPIPQKLGWAFMEYVERYPLDRLPMMGGMAATIVVSVEADVFTQGASKPGRADTGVSVSPGELLRWACMSRVMPAVLDKDGHVLDLGRSHRLHTSAQRLALIIEQKTCRHPTCHTLGAFCHVHHTTPWGRGGETNTSQAVLLCPFHHHQIHADNTDNTDRIDYPLRT